MLEGNYTNDLLFCQAFDMIYRMFTQYCVLLHKVRFTLLLSSLGGSGKWKSSTRGRPGEVE